MLTLHILYSCINECTRCKTGVIQAVSFLLYENLKGKLLELYFFLTWARFYRLLYMKP